MFFNLFFLFFSINIYAKSKTLSSFQNTSPQPIINRFLDKESIEESKNEFLKKKAFSNVLKPKKIKESNRSNSTELDKNILSSSQNFNFPVILGHVPENLSSIRIVSKENETIIAGEVSFIESQYKQINLDKYISNLSILKPRIQLGGAFGYNTGSLIYISALSYMNYKNHGIGIKIFIKHHTMDLNELINIHNENKYKINEDFYGHFVVYYFFNYFNLLKNSDFTSFYLGWLSNSMIFENLDQIQERAKKLINSKNLILGVIYNPSVLKTYYYGIETDLKNHILISISFKLNF